MKVATSAAARVVFLVVERTFLRSLREAAEAVRNEVGPLEVPVHVLSDVQGEAGWAAVERDVCGATAIFAVHVTEQGLADRLTEMLRRASPAPGAFVPINSVASLMRLTRIGRLNFGAERGFMARFGSVIRRPNGRRSAESFTGFVGKVSRWLRFAPGWGHDLRTYLLLYSFYLHSSPENLRGLLLLVLKECGGLSVSVPAPVEYPPTALYHPDAPRQFEELADYLAWYHGRPGAPPPDAPRVGVILFRSFVLNRNTAHYDAVIRAIEARGLVPLPALAFALDNRVVQRRYFGDVRAILSLTGFGYVGGMGANDAAGAVDALSVQGVPYLDALALTFQRIEQWRDSGTGLNPLQSMMQVAIPELDGAIEPFIFGGITEGQLDFQPLDERIERLAERLARLVALAGLPNASKRIAVTLFNFPPNKGNLGTAAYLDVFASLQRLLLRLRDAGYDVEVPASADALRQALIGGNSDAMGTVANVAAHIATADYLRQWPYAREVEQAWGRAPGLLNANGAELFVLGRHFGNVFVGLQPTFGYEGDPLRLMA
ncbi:MAG: cobaltochelatase subunit CobN, partial [Chloroflexota bacterium]